MFFFIYNKKGVCQLNPNKMINQRVTMIMTMTIYRPKKLELVIVRKVSV